MCKDKDERLIAEMCQRLDAMNSPWQMKESQVEMITDCVQEENSHNRESQVEMQKDPVKKYSSIIKYVYAILVALALIPAAIHTEILFRVPAKPDILVSSTVVEHHYNELKGLLVARHQIELQQSTRLSIPAQR